MKKFTLGFVIGGIVCSALTGFAVEYAVTANPFPIKVDGVSKSIEGYNINDSTYFKLRDAADAVGGFTVGFVNNTFEYQLSEDKNWIWSGGSWADMSVQDPTEADLQTIRDANGLN